MLFQMIKKSPFFICAGAMLVFASCSGEETTDVDTNETIIETEGEEQVSAPRMINPESLGLEEAKDVNGEEEANVLQQAPPTVNDPSAKVLLNPPHGEPGHDCAIPVGQPLNSGASAGIQQPTITTAPVNANQPVINTPNTGQVRLNPPHGEPGHDCAVPVGQPLS